MSAFLRVAALLAAALLSACASEFVRPVPQGTVGGGETVDIVVAVADHAHFTRMAVFRGSDSAFYLPAPDWGLPDVAAKAVADTLKARHPGMTMQAVRKDFSPKEVKTFDDAFASGYDKPYGTLHTGEGGRVADYVRQSSADLVVLVSTVMDRLPSSHPNDRGVPADGFGLFSAVTGYTEIPRVAAFAAVRVIAVVKPELMRIGIAEATDCFDMICPAGRPSRWKDDGRKYGSWTAVEEGIYTDPALQATVRKDVTEALDGAVRRAVTALKF